MCSNPNFIWQKYNAFTPNQSHLEGAGFENPLKKCSEAAKKHGDRFLSYQ